MKIMLFSKDSTIFLSGNDITGDTRKRHILYAQKLQKKQPGSCIVVITYTKAKERFEREEIAEGLIAYPTNSLTRLFYLWDVLRLFLRIYKDWKPDLISAQTPYEEGLLGLLLSKIFRCKFLPQIHFDLFSQEWLKEHWLNPCRRVVAEYVIKKAGKARVVSRSLKEQMHSLLKLPLDNIYIVPVGVNFKPRNDAASKVYYKKSISPDLQDKCIALFAGRICEAKNLSLWIEAAAELADSFPDLHFVIVGDGHKRQEIETLVKIKRLTEKIHFLGQVGYEKIPDIYAAADIFLLTSNNEGFGRVIIEAYLVGIPVVSTKCAGPEELIQDGLTGFLVPLGDKEGLVRKMGLLVRDQVLRQQMGLRGKAYAEEHYSLDTLADCLIESWLCVAKPKDPAEGINEVTVV